MSAFDINKRFDFLIDLTQMVANKISPSLIITGEGGLGKTYTVKNTLKKMNIVETDYVMVKGYTTPKGLYNLLYDNKDKLILFDDCDSVFDTDASCNILKSALDSYDTRTISWKSSAKNAGYPNEFEFTGSIIFISNRAKKSIDNAIISRSHVVDLEMSIDDKLKRMTKILPYMCKHVSFNMRCEMLNLIKQHKDSINELNLRTLIKLCDIRHTKTDGNWLELSLYTMLES